MNINVEIYQELRRKYVADFPTLPTQFPNEAFTEPVPAAIWGRFAVEVGKETQVDIGSEIKTFRVNGMLSIQLFAPSEQGTIDILENADSIANKFRNWVGTKVRCREATVKKIGNDIQSRFQVNISVPFKVDYLH